MKNLSLTDYVQTVQTIKEEQISTYKAIDLFAGIGGIRMGFDQAFGRCIKTVFVSEWDAQAQKTYRANYRDAFNIAGDITTIDESDVPPFDICLAGFPCQAFSLAGQRKVIGWRRFFIPLLKYFAKKQGHRL